MHGQDEPIDVSKLPISPIRTVGGLHFLGGVVGLATNTTLVEGGVKAELHRIFELIKALLHQQHGQLRHICKMVVYFAEGPRLKKDDFALLNKVCHEIFGKEAEFPARTTVWVASLPLDANVEIEAIAVANPNKHDATEEHPKHAHEGRRGRR